MTSTLWGTRKKRLPPGPQGPVFSILLSPNPEGCDEEDAFDFSLTVPEDAKPFTIAIREQVIDIDASVRGDRRNRAWSGRAKPNDLPPEPRLLANALLMDHFGSVIWQSGSLDADALIERQDPAGADISHKGVSSKCPARKRNKPTRFVVLALDEPGFRFRRNNPPNDRLPVSTQLRAADADKALDPANQLSMQGHLGD